MNEKLEPCPFCGSEAGIPTNLDGTPVDYEITDCCCKNDDCPLADYWTPIKIWQTRPTEDALRKRIAELTECIGSQMADVYTLKARVAELSQTVGLITTLKPTMVMDVDHPLDMAKEVVEHVTARIAELEEKQRWRVVANGELPKIGIPVLFLADWGSIYEGCTYDGKTIALYDLEDYEDSDITHWMPRPVLPEVQE